MTLLAEIQTDAIDTSVSVSVLLRKCLLLAARLGHAPLREWVENELNGYPNGDVVPPYRAKQPARVRGDFSGPMNFCWQGAEIPKSAVPEQWRETLFTVEFTSSVAEYEALVATDDGSFRIPWPTDVVTQVATGI